MSDNNLKSQKIVEIVNNKYIKNFIDNNNLSSSFIADNFSVFEDCFESLKLCANCPGLDKCKQKKKGEFLGLVNEGFVNNNVNYCKYLEVEERKEEYIRSFVYSDIPAIYADLNLNNIEISEDELKPLYVMCYDIYENKRNKGLYIYGDFGRGKTYMSIALANSLVKKGKKVAFIKVSDFATKMAELIRDDAYEYERLVRRINKVDYLFLDDLGTELVTEFTRDKLLFNILDYRMEHKLTTVICSNLDKKTLLQTYSGNQNSTKAKRIFERIDILTEDFCLKGTDKRRSTK